MKKLFLFVVFLLLFIPTSVRASGLFDFALITERTGFLIRGNEIEKTSAGNKNTKKIPCKFGFRFDYRYKKCEKVVVPEHGVLNEDGISVRCQIGYRLQGTGDRVQCIKVMVPAHAQLSGTGDDFQCDRDYVRVGDSCERLIIPANAHIAAGGNDFDCNTGFRRVQVTGNRQQDVCEAVFKPVNAKFFPYSDDWYCENGYQRVDNRCESLNVPANARAAETGTFFYCLPGHRLAENGRDCEQIKIAENAEPNWTGGWNCKVGYKRVDDRCEKIAGVEHGKLLSDSGFYCEERFKRDEENRKCVPIVLPENAEWDSASYEGWRCKQGYAKQGERCEVFKLPEHAYWVGFNSWECDAGYVKGYSVQGIGDRCEKVTIPDNAHPSKSWGGWDCDAGFVKNYKDLKCEKI